MRRIATAVVMLMLVGLPAQALTTKDILSLVAMPLAVDAVSNLTGVPTNDLAAIVSRLNQANVPPTQFVQVVRYVPAALVVNSPQQPTLVQFVDQQTQQGITGPALVDAINQQLVTTYRVTPAIQTYAPETLLTTQADYVPDSVLARLDTGADPLSVALMPLAVAAVADLAGVPQDQLASLVATLNNANVPPAQFVQVMRYVPVALVTDNNGQQFVAYVQQQVAQGITGPALVPVINQQLPSYGVPQSQITVFSTPVQSSPQPVRQIVPMPVDQNYFPPVVQEHVARASGNPHGGPPGQLKKQLGLQTGAEVVHGYKPGRDNSPNVAAAPVAAPPVEKHGHEGKGKGRPAQTQPMISASPAPAEQEGHGHGHEGRVPPGQAKKEAPVYMPPAQLPPTVAAPPAGPPAIPPGQAKKKGGEGDGHGKDGNGNGHGHGKD